LLSGQSADVTATAFEKKFARAPQRACRCAPN
jgi:hypothetical protein